MEHDPGPHQEPAARHLRLPGAGPDRTHRARLPDRGRRTDCRGQPQGLRPDARDDLAHFQAIRRQGEALFAIHQPIFDRFNITRQLENAFSRQVHLKSGGYIVVDETEALVAIDVNTGRHKGGKDQESTILKVNLEAAEEICRQLRLRNMGGLIVLDFIDMKSRRDQQAVYQRMKEGLRRDKAKTHVLPISQLGLMEMTRQRHSESVRAAVYDDCPYCKGRGKVKSALTMSVEIQRKLSEILKKRVARRIGFPASHRGASQRAGTPPHRGRKVCSSRWRSAISANSRSALIRRSMRNNFEFTTPPTTMNSPAQDPERRFGAADPRPGL